MLIILYPSLSIRKTIRFVILNTVKNLISHSNLLVYKEKEVNKAYSSHFSSTCWIAQIGQFISASDHFSLGRSALTYFFPSFTRQYHCITQTQQWMQYSCFTTTLFSIIWIKWFKNYLSSLSPLKAFSNLSKEGGIWFGRIFFFWGVEDIAVLKSLDFTASKRGFSRFFESFSSVFLFSVMRKKRK